MIAKNISSMLGEEELSDVRFRVDGKEVHAHKAILTARSDYFRAMFTGGMKESKDSVIEVPNISHAVFVKVLEFLYTDKVDEESISLSAGQELLVAAEMHHMKRLKAICEVALCRFITAETVASLLLTSHRHSAMNLKKSCAAYVKRNWEKLQDHFWSELDAEPDLLAFLSELDAEPDLLAKLALETKSKTIKRRNGWPSISASVGAALLAARGLAACGLACGWAPTQAEFALATFAMAATVLAAVHVAMG
jgi:hypothetical protein